MSSATYVVKFDRLGRRHDIAPLTVKVAYDDDAAGHEVAAQVHAYARKYLHSQHVDVSVEMGEMPGTGGYGTVHAGMRVGGTFTVEPAASA